MRSFLWKNRFELGVLLGVIALFFPIMAHWSILGDFEPHAEFTLRMLANEPDFLMQRIPNFLWHASVGVPYAVLGIVPLTTYITIVNVLWYVFLGGIIFWQLRLALARDNTLSGRDGAIAIVMTLALMMIVPINLFFPDSYYFGFVYPYVYHNPTMIPLRPLALLMFFVGVWSFNPSADRTQYGLRLAVVALLSLACVWAKPSYTMVFIPALGLVVLWRLLRREFIDWGMVVIGLGLPSVGLIGLQALTYTSGGMEFSPLLVFDLWAYHYDPLANQNLALKLVLSIAFPLVVYIAYWAQARRDLTLNFAWIGFIIGVLYAYLFVDSGDRVAGNLSWNAQIGLMVLYIVAGIFWWRTHRQHPNTARFWAVAIVFGLHVVSGILWIVAHMTTTYLDLIYKVW